MAAKKIPDDISTNSKDQLPHPDVPTPVRKKQTKRLNQ